MKPIFTNLIAIISGVVIGGLVNMGIIMIGGYIIPPPAGADTSTMEGLQAAMHLFEAKHFLFPFLAHALGTFVGALIAARIAATYKMFYAMATGAFFLLGGISMVVQIPAPVWFSAVDLIFAYIPTAYLAGKIIIKGEE